MEDLPPLTDVELQGTGDPLVAALVPAGFVEGVRVVRTHRVDAPRLADNHLPETRHTYTIKAPLWHGRV